MGLAEQLLAFIEPRRKSGAIAPAAQRPRNINRVAWFCAIAAQGFTLWHGAADHYVANELFGARKVAAGKSRVGLFRELEKAIVESGHPSFVGPLWKRQRNQAETGCGAHGSNVTQAASESAASQRFSIQRPKMYALNEQVGRENE